MVPITSLWLPILLSAVFVFVISSIIHMVLGYHRTDFRKIPDEDDVQDALRKFNIPPGDYALPCPSGPQDMRSPEFLEKWKKGPVMLITTLKAGVPSMTGSLILWFLYTIVIGLFAAYLAGRALGPGADYLDVFRFAGTTSFAAYNLALWQNSIWLGRSWSTTIKSTLDGLVYALVTAGTFGWLWPR